MRGVQLTNEDESNTPNIETVRRTEKTTHMNIKCDVEINTTTMYGVRVRKKKF